MSQERSRAALCAAYFFLAMASYYILKPVRESFFMQEQGYDQLPQAHLAVGFVTFLAAQVYAFLARRVSGRGLVVRTNLFFIGCVLAFWFTLGPGHAGNALRARLSWVYYIWVSVFAVFVVTLFWSLAHDTFTPEQGSRLYGLIGAGGIMGGVVGGFMARTLARHLGSVNLLLVSAALLAPCTLIGLRLGRDRGTGANGAGKSGPIVAQPAANATAGVAQRSLWRLFASDPYVCGIGLIVFLYQVIGVLVDYQVHMLLQATVKAQDERTAFFGSLFAAANGLGLCINLFVAGPVQMRFGPFPGLIVLPILATVGGIVLSGHPGLVAVTIVSVLGTALTYSIHQSSRELLYLPKPPEVKFVAKGFIDTFLFRAGNAMAAVWILMDPPAGDSSRVSWRVIPLALVMSVNAVWLARRYRMLVSGQYSETPAADGR